MASDFCFGNINIKSKKNVMRLKTAPSIVLADQSMASSSTQEYPAIVILDEYREDRQVVQIEKFLKNCGLYKYIILSPIVYSCSREEIEKEQKEGIIKFYKANSIKFSDYITPMNPIITSGPAIYALLQEDDIYPKYVNQRPFAKTNFWFSYDLTSNGNWIYPIESFEDIMDWRTGRPYDSYKTKLARLQIRDVLNKGTRQPVKYPELNKIFITSEEEFDELFYQPNKDKRNELLSWDIETSGFDFTQDVIGCITLSFDGITGYYIPWKFVDKRKLNYILGNNRQLGANLKFDVSFLRSQGITKARIDDDVYLLGHTLDETRSNSLKTLAFLYSEYGGYERALDVYKDKYNIDNYLDIDEDILKEYAIMDAIVCRRIFPNMMTHMRELDKKIENDKYPSNTLEVYYRTRRIPAVNMYSKIEYRGCYVNKAKLDALRVQMREVIRGIELELAEDFGVSKDFNWSSSEKLGNLLKSKGWEDLGTNSKGGYKVSAGQLVRWAKTHPEAKKLQRLSSLTTLIDTFVGDDEGTKGWSQYLRHHDEDPPHIWRMHAHYNALGTDSGRTRCSNPNMQNVPTRGEFAKEIKSCLCTPNDDEFYMVTIDYSSLQLKLSASDGEDLILQTAFSKRGSDLHSLTSYSIFGRGKELDVEIIEVEDEEGNVHKYLAGELVETERGEILAKDLLETDKIVG